MRSEKEKSWLSGLSEATAGEWGTGDREREVDTKFPGAQGGGRKPWLGVLMKDAAARRTKSESGVVG